MSFIIIMVNYNTIVNHYIVISHEWISGIEINVSQYSNLPITLMKINGRFICSDYKNFTMWDVKVLYMKILITSGCVLDIDGWRIK